MALSRTKLQNIVKNAFAALGDVPESATFRRTSSAYDTSTGANVVTNTNTAIEAVFTGYQAFEVDRNIVLATDVKMIMEQRHLTVTPSPATDKIVRADGRIYNILRVFSDPVGATYTFQLRAP